MPELVLTANGERALREAQNFCWRMNVAIVASEHILAGALLVLGREGVAGIPPEAALAAGLESIHGVGSEPLTDNVMLGSNARDALDRAIGAIEAGGASEVDARAIALGLIGSGEIHPMFYACIGATREGLQAALGGE